MVQAAIHHFDLAPTARAEAAAHLHILLLADVPHDAELVAEHLGYATRHIYHGEVDQLAGYEVDAEQLARYDACLLILRVPGQLPGVISRGNIQRVLPTIVISAIAEEEFGVDFCALGVMNFLPMLHVSTGTLDRHLRYARGHFRAMRQLEEWAFVDHLTGAATRRLFNFQLEKMADRARRSGTYLTLCLLDLDNFKSINDIHGHIVGDAVLRECVTRVRSVLRAYDLVGRFGGDEFSVVLEGTDLHHTHEILERLQQIFDNGFQFREQSIAMRCSLGAVRFRPGEMSTVAAFEAADTELANAKRAGKNRYSLRAC